MEQDLEKVQNDIDVILTATKVGYMMSEVELDNEEDNNLLFDFCSAAAQLIPVAQRLMDRHGLTPEDIIIRRMALDMELAQQAIVGPD